MRLANRQGMAALLGAGLIGLAALPAGADGPEANRRDIAADAGLPAPYADLANPLSVPPVILAEGARLYADNCRPCHGPGGRGDGEGSTNPPPPSLRRPAFEGLAAADAYLMWAISEGGAAIGTQMPAYKLALDDDERWRLVAFIAADFATGR